jgi:hypothetical protein
MPPKSQKVWSLRQMSVKPELGDLFVYKLHDRVTIRKNLSALVPILQSRIDAEKVSVWNPSGSSVLRALWVDNTSGLTLDGGSFNVLEGDAFAGEGLMDPIKPGENACSLTPPTWECSSMARSSRIRGA